MQQAFLDQAEQTSVSHAIRDVLEKRGALVTEHVSSRVRFHLAGSRLEWQREGYVGVYQRLGEKDVEVRLVLRAKWPHRILWTVALVDVLGALLTFVLNPPGTTWFVVAFLEGTALLVAGLLYLNTWTSAREEERALMREFEAEFHTDAVAVVIEGADEREQRDAEAALQGEVEMVRVERDRKAAPKPERKPARAPKFKLGLRKKEPEESPDETRARLLARKAELEAQQAADEREKPE